MGQAQSCIARDSDEVEIVAAAPKIPFPAEGGGGGLQARGDSRSIERDLTSLHRRAGRLHTLARDLRDEMLMLRTENGQLLDSNSGLAKENLRLRRQLEEHELQKMWRTFDVVEQHYLQLEHHRAQMLSGSREPTAGDTIPEVINADAAGGPPVHSAHCMVSPLPPTALPRISLPPVLTMEEPLLAFREDSFRQEPLPSVAPNARAEEARTGTPNQP